MAPYFFILSQIKSFKRIGLLLTLLSCKSWHNAGEIHAYTEFSSAERLLKMCTYTQTHRLFVLYSGGFI